MWVRHVRRIHNTDKNSAKFSEWAGGTLAQLDPADARDFYLAVSSLD